MYLHGVYMINGIFLNTIYRITWDVMVISWGYVSTDANIEYEPEFVDHFRASSGIEQKNVYGFHGHGGTSIAGWFISRV